MSIEKWLEEVPFDGPTPWAMDSFVIGREGLTDWGAFRQALREVSLRRGQPSSPRRDRELAHFERRAREFGERLGELTPERIDELDRDHYHKRAQLMVAVDLLTIGRVSATTVDLMLALKPEARAKLLDLAKCRDEMKLQALVVAAGEIR